MALNIFCEDTCNSASPSPTWHSSSGPCPRPRPGCARRCGCCRRRSSRPRQGEPCRPPPWCPPASVRWSQSKLFIECLQPDWPSYSTHFWLKFWQVLKFGLKPPVETFSSQRIRYRFCIKRWIRCLLKRQDGCLRGCEGNVNLLKLVVLCKVHTNIFVTIIQPCHVGASDPCLEKVSQSGPGHLRCSGGLGNTNKSLLVWVWIWYKSCKWTFAKFQNHGFLKTFYLLEGK